MTRNTPNIVVFIADQLRSDALGCYGNKYVKTPNIDALAKEGVTFENAYVCQPLCVPQRCSMISGLYPSVHGSSKNGIPLDKSLPVYPEILRQSGYQTFAAGKMHLGPISRGFDDPPYEPGEAPSQMPYYGFEQVEFIEGESSGYMKMLNENGYPCDNPHDHLRYDENGPFQTAVDALPEELNRSTYVADKSIDFLENRDKSKPFLMHCSFWDPHHPFVVPETYKDMYDPDEMPSPIAFSEEDFENLPEHFKTYRKSDRGKQGKSFEEHTEANWKKMKAYYYGMISLMDKNIGRVMDALKKDGLEDDTVIIFVSDHGEILGDHGIALKGNFHYDSLIKVPLIIRMPEKVKERRVEGKVMSYDIMPSILELAGTAVPKRITAKSLMPLLEEKEYDFRECVMTEAPGTCTVVKNRYKMSMHFKSDEKEFYDLENDPQETKNLWSDGDDKIKIDMLAACAKAMKEAQKPTEKPIGRW
jgi:arylsulfatase A-like enzyme